MISPSVRILTFTERTVFIHLNSNYAIDVINVYNVNKNYRLNGFFILSTFTIIINYTLNVENTLSSERETDRLGSRNLRNSNT